MSDRYANRELHPIGVEHLEVCLFGARASRRRIEGRAVLCRATGWDEGRLHGLGCGCNERGRLYRLRLGGSRKPDIARAVDLKVQKLHRLDVDIHLWCRRCGKACRQGCNGTRGPLRLERSEE